MKTTPTFPYDFSSVGKERETTNSNKNHHRTLFEKERQERENNKRLSFYTHEHFHIITETMTLKAIYTNASQQSPEQTTKPKSAQRVKD